MPVNAVLKIEGKNFNLLQANYNFFKPVGHTGYVGGRTRLTKMVFLLPSAGSTFFLHWMFQPKLQKSGSISFYEDENLTRKVKKVVFAGGFCVGYKEVFHGISHTPLYTELVISAGGIKIEESEFRFPWFKDSFKTEGEEAVEEALEYLPRDEKENAAVKGKENAKNGLTAIGPSLADQIEYANQLEEAYHMKSDAYAQSVMDAIDPKYFNDGNRFGPGFYIADTGCTSIAEVVHHGGDPAKSKIIRFELDKSKIYELDLTNSEIAKIYSYEKALKYEKLVELKLLKNPNSKLDKYAECKKIAIKAQREGYNCIKFPSKRLLNGVNRVVFLDTKESASKILKPKMIMPATE